MKSQPFNAGAAPGVPQQVVHQPEPTLPTLIATKDADTLQTTDFNYAGLLVYPDGNNVGNVWIGGPDVTAGHGIPLKNCAPIKIEKPTTWAYFEKAGDKLYRLDW